MFGRLKNQFCLTLAGLITLIGCQQGYNGAWLMSPEERQTVQAYRDSRSTRSAAVPSGSSNPTTTTKISVRNTVSRAEPIRVSSDPTDVVSTGKPQSTEMVSTSAPVSTEPVMASRDNPPKINLALSTPTTQPAPAPSAVRGPGLYGQLDVIDREGVDSQDGSDNLRRVTFTREGSDFDPAVDPSGTLLVFASTLHSSSSDLFVKHVNGTAVTQLTNDPANDVMPAFSPDGRQVAFASDRSGNWDIYMMDTNGGPAVQLTVDPTHDVHPSFSPDGTQLVYSSFSAQSGQWELVVIDLNTPAAKRYIGPGLFPHWSPVDDRIAYQRAQQRGTNWFSIWVMELVNGEGVRPTQIAVTPNSASITPCWSPDGKRLAFTTVVNPEAGQDDAPPRADIWIINTDGSRRVNLTRSRFANLQPAWSANGSIYFRSNRSESRTENIWSTRPDRALRTINPTQEEQKTALVPVPEES